MKEILIRNSEDVNIYVCILPSKIKGATASAASVLTAAPLMVESGSSRQHRKDKQKHRLAFGDNSACRSFKRPAIEQRWPGWCDAISSRRKI